VKLSRVESRWAEAAMEAIFPGSSEMGLTDIGTMDVGGFLRDLMRDVPWKAALGVRLAIWLVALAPLFVVRRLATITQLGRADRERVVASLVASESYAIRSLVLVLKAVGALLYAADRGVRARMTPPPKSGVVRIGVKPSARRLTVPV
jgi:hypothetical protein